MLTALWNLSAAIRGYLRFYMPTNRAVDWLRSPRGLKWAIPVALVATPAYLGLTALAIQLAARSGPRLPQRAGLPVLLERREVRLDGRPLSSNDGRQRAQVDANGNPGVGDDSIRRSPNLSVTTWISDCGVDTSIRSAAHGWSYRKSKPTPVCGIRRPSVPRVGCWPGRTWIWCETATAATQGWNRNPSACVSAARVKPPTLVTGSNDVRNCIDELSRKGTSVPLGLPEHGWG